MFSACLFWHSAVLILVMIIANLYIKKTGTYIDTIKEYNSNKEEEEMKRDKNASMISGATAGIASAIILNSLIKK